jgi:hypothetical protein
VIEGERLLLRATFDGEIALEDRRSRIVSTARRGDRPLSTELILLSATCREDFEAIPP